MKLQIVVPNQPAIENFERVEVRPNSIDLSHISDNECTMILANDIVDSFSVDNIASIVTSLTKKVRMGGEIVVGGTDIRLFCKAVINGQMDEPRACQIVGALQSMSNYAMVEQVLQQLKFQILSTQISGVHFEIKAKRV